MSVSYFLFYYTTTHYCNLQQRTFTTAVITNKVIHALPKSAHDAALEHFTNHFTAHPWIKLSNLNESSPEGKTVSNFLLYGTWRQDFPSMQQLILITLNIKQLRTKTGPQLLKKYTNHIINYSLLISQILISISLYYLYIIFKIKIDDYRLLRSGRYVSASSSPCCHTVLLLPYRILRSRTTGAR